jgi:hypothetical protein
MSNALTIDASNLRNIKPQVHAALILAKNQDVGDFTTAIPITAGSGAPNHNAAVINELYVRTDASDADLLLYRAINTSGSWETVVGSELTDFLAANNAFTGALTTTDAVGSGVARKIGGTASVAVASTTLGPTGGTAENTIGTYTILANTFKAGTLAELFASVRCTAQTGATTCTFRLKLGGTTLFTSAAVDLAAGDVFNFAMNIVSRAAPSASSSLVVAGDLTAIGASTDISKAISLAPANYATDGALALVLTAQMSASDANAISCDMYNVKLTG